MVLNLIHYLCSVKIANEYMKKTLKFIGYSVLAIILLIVVGVLLIRFVFRDEVANFAYELRGKEHIELLQMANQYQSDTIKLHLNYHLQQIKQRKYETIFNWIL